MIRRLAARAARRRRRRRASTADVFVSRHTAVPREDVDAYVKSRILPPGGPSQAARVDGSGANLLLKECPSAGFCSPTKYAGTGKPGNEYKFAILRDGGYLTEEEIPAVRKVLNAAAWTYVASALVAVLSLIRLLVISGLLGGRDE